MKQAKFLFLTLLTLPLFLGSAAPAERALAREDAAQIIKKQEVTLKDLGISDTGMLPGNPFYFLKEWGREVKKSLTFGSLKRAELQLDLANERAAEIKKLKDLLPSSSKALTKALDNYDKSVELLKERIGDLEGSISGSEIDDFLNRLSDYIIKHVKLFSELKESIGDKNKKRLSDLQEKAVEIIAEIPLKMETSNEFKCRLEKIIKSQNDSALKEITIAEILDRLDEKIPKDARLELLKIKENLLIRFQSRLQSEDFNQVLSELLTQLPGDSIRKIKIIDEIREGVSNNDIKNNLNLIRQDILEKAKEDKKIRKPEAEKIIGEADSLLKDLENSVNSTSTPKSAIIGGLFTKAKFNLEQAKEALFLNNYGQAFGQASASAAAANAGLNYISKFNLDINPCAEEDVRSLKKYYDELASKIKEMNLNKKNSPEVLSLLEESENKIAKISDLVNKNAKVDTLIPLLKDSKLLLSRIDNILAEMLSAD